MKKYLRYILPVCLAGSLCTSCTDFFETDSDGVLKTEGQRYQDETYGRVCLYEKILHTDPDQPLLMPLRTCRQAANIQKTTLH